MKVPSSPVDAEMPPIDQTPTKVESPQPAPIRLLPLTPVGGWYWLRGKQEKAALQSAPPIKRPSFRLARARRMTICGRRVLLWVLFWYVAFQMVPTVLKDRWHRIGPHYEFHKWPALERLVAEEPDRPLLVMVGSSRTAWAFQSSALDGMPDSDGRPMLVYNFGIPSTGPLFQLFCLRDMLAKGIRPRFLLIECLPPLLCAARRGVATEESPLGFESFTFRRMLQWMPYLQRPKKCATLWVEARIAPCYTFRKELVGELISLATGHPIPKHVPIDNRGWHLSVPAVSLLWHESRLVAAHVAYGEALLNFRLGKTPYRAIHELLDLCRREKIPSALVLMPEDSQFRSWYSPGAKTAIRNLLDELKQTYGVECIDAQCWLPDYQFEDGHHALLGGTLIFTRRIRAELPRLLAQSKAVKSD
ncbi:MAG TPA: hypothetical protein VMF69_23100 [Gemmataceae bacterium]|nr:hypothetical protein [Gemmataceae bacterium]